LGSIKLIVGRNTLLDEGLPEKVEETYARWKDDRRHKSWTTDPRYRIVIPEGESARR